jgi:predicted RNA binding protein YcfA (HicA-like mRNA interferase family)
MMMKIYIFFILLIILEISSKFALSAARFNSETSTINENLINTDSIHNEKPSLRSFTFIFEDGQWSNAITSKSINDSVEPVIATLLLTNENLSSSLNGQGSSCRLGGASFLNTSAMASAMQLSPGLAGGAVITFEIPVVGQIILGGTALTVGAYYYIGTPLADLISKYSPNSIPNGSERLVRKSLEKINNLNDTKSIKNYFKSCSKIKSFLEDMGFSAGNQAGSHNQFKHPLGALFTLACHGEKNISPASIQALKSLLNDIQKYLNWLKVNKLL